MIQIRNFINGQWQEETGGKTVPLYNPSTGETIGSVPVSNMETCEAAIATAAGCEMVIANGQAPELLYDIAAGKPVGTRFLTGRANT